MPARTSSGVRNAFSGVSASLGTSVRSVHAEGGAIRSAASRTFRPTCRIDFERNGVMRTIRWLVRDAVVAAVRTGSELDLQAGRERPRAGVRHVVDATRRRARYAGTGADEYLGV